MLQNYGNKKIVIFCKYMDFTFRQHLRKNKKSLYFTGILCVTEEVTLDKMRTPWAAWNLRSDCLPITINRILGNEVQVSCEGSKRQQTSQNMKVRNITLFHFFNFKLL